MFKESKTSSQQNLFSSGSSLLTGKALKLYEVPKAWHNQFRNQITLRVNESLFSPLYCPDNGSPNSSLRVMFAMMVLKEALGLSDDKIFEDARFNMLTRSALGIFNADEAVPTESTYYLFRKRINDYAEAGNGNLFELAFAEITHDQCKEFNVSGKRIRMDSKLLGSNIAWLGRYELVHETLRLFYLEAQSSIKFPRKTRKKLDALLKVDGNKIVYTSSTDELKSKLQELGKLIYKVLLPFKTAPNPHCLTLQKVFDEQFYLDENKKVLSRDKKEISAKSVQSPHDTDCDFRDKGGKKVKGYSLNVTESCSDGSGLDLVANVDVRKVSTSDVDFFQDAVNATSEVLNEKAENVHTDGAYHSPANQAFCESKGIDLHLHAIQGKKSRYKFTASENGEILIYDKKKEKPVESVRSTDKNGKKKWRIDDANSYGRTYRYFTQKDVDAGLIRNKIEETPIETLHKRNNVEATIFQMGYHYSRGKSRYRGLIKHQMWANIRALWVNFVRISKHVRLLPCKDAFFVKNQIGIFIYKLYGILLGFLTSFSDKRNKTQIKLLSTAF